MNITGFTAMTGRVASVLQGGCPPALVAFCCTVQRPFHLHIVTYEDEEHKIMEALEAVVGPSRPRIGLHDTVDIELGY